MSSSARNKLTSANDKIIESRDLDGESDSDFSMESSLTLDWL